MYFVYIIECSDKSLYVGITTDVARRVEEHNSSNLGAKYTRGRRPVTVRYIEEAETRSEASHRENIIKKMGHKKKIKLIAEQSDEAKFQTPII